MKKGKEKKDKWKRMVRGQDYQNEVSEDSLINLSVNKRYSTGMEDNIGISKRARLAMDSNIEFVPETAEAVVQPCREL